MNELLNRVLKRSCSMFQEDIEDHRSSLDESIRGTRLLVLGAAGSIGSAFVKQVAFYSPECLHLVDLSENNLVRLVRDLRSSLVIIPDDFKTFAIGLGSLEFERFFSGFSDYDYVINFSAMKHVRSERDPYTLMRMFATNVNDFKGLLDQLVETKTKKVFSVSSDKAVNPASVMGATKIFMERVLLDYSRKIAFSTARFANVAFSDGSLLCGFQQWFADQRPFSAPRDVTRYFISHEEAGQLCLLSCFLGENREVYFPKLDPDADLVPFTEIATIFLETHGYEPELCQSEEEAKIKASQLERDSTKWPCYFFDSDTTGEKPFEEFFEPGDEVCLDRYRSVGVLQQPEMMQHELVRRGLDAIEQIRASTVWKKQDIVDAIRIVVPELVHEEKGKNLDQKL